MISRVRVEEYVNGLPRLEASTRFTFGCHPGVSCFNACCQDLTLMLSPYDVLRLRSRVELESEAFLTRHTGITYRPDTGVPEVCLQMREDEAKTCPFASEGGCSVYGDRPGACRAFPIGRGARVDRRGVVEERFALVRDPACQGFVETTAWTARRWLRDQGLESYDQYNDLFTKLIAKWRDQGLCLSRDQRLVVFLALYRVDVFPTFIAKHDLFAAMETPPATRDRILADEDERLRFALQWLTTL